MQINHARLFFPGPATSNYIPEILQIYCNLIIMLVLGSTVESLL